MKDNSIVDLRAAKEAQDQSGAAPGAKKPGRRPLSRRQKIVIGIIVAVVAVGGAGAWYYWFSGYAPVAPAAPAEEIAASVSTPAAPLSASLLTGLSMTNEEALRPPTAIMIENISSVFDDQYGLTSADVVYETLAEGGIPRFAAVFQSRYPKQIGPVRSARPYYPDMIQVYGPKVMYVYSGAAKIIDDDVINRIPRPVNAGYNGPYFWRGPQGAPHNLFTSSELLASLRKDKGWDDLMKTGEIDAWTFQAGTAAKNDQEVAVNFSSATYQVRWEYNQENDSYMRFNAGGEHIDQESDRQIEVSNVVIMKTKMGIWEDGPDDGKGRIEVEINNTGGSGLILKNGQAIEIDWTKGGERDNFQFYQKGTKNLIPLQPGKSWVQVIPDDKEWEIE